MTLQDILAAIDNLSQEEKEVVKKALETPATRSPEKRKPRIPDLHPDAIVIDERFFEPLPDSFWLGEE